jgi:hypothetical protein
MTLPSLEVSDGAIKRARLRAEYFAIHAAATAKVRDFRCRVIAQGRPLPLPILTEEGGIIAPDSREDAEYATVSSETARTFLASPAIALLTVEDFEVMRRSVIDSLKSVDVTDVKTDGEIVSFTIQLEDEGREPIGQRFTFPVSTAVRLDQLDPLTDWSTMLLGSGTGFLRRGSVFDELRLLSEWLSLEFPWHPWDAAWFVLTGEHPMRPVIEAGWTIRQSRSHPHADARITFSIDATLSPDEVASHYAKVRDELLGGTRIRLAEPRTLEVFRFVSSRRLQNPTVTWRELVQEWDQECPENWRFEGNEKAFRLYWRRGLRSVFPEFGTHPKPRPEKERP